ncbi:MAG: SpoIIE family protein phosphatase [Candidatus Velthaea sp.]
MQAADTLPITVWMARPDGRIDYVNRRWEETTGLAPGEILDEAWQRIVHPDDLPHVAAVYAGAIERSTPFSVDLRIRAHDASYRWVRSQCEPMRDSSGRVVRWFGIVLDIDEAHRAQDRFRVVTEALPVIVWSADADGWIEWYNRRWYDYTGLSHEEARGWGWQAAHHPDDFQDVMRRWPHSLETGQPFEMEFRLRRYDGVFHWFLTRVEPLRDEDGKIIGWYGSNVDIDAQKKALERSKRIAETLQDIFLPKAFPERGDLRIDAAYIAAEKDALVGGDWYDAFETPDGCIAFSIGDVAGHGLDASVLVGRLRQVIFTLAFKGTDPAQILADTNRILQYQNPDTFVTAIVGFISEKRDCVTYANAGHPPPILASKRDTSASMLRQADLPLGVIADPAYTKHSVAIEPDDLLVLYTDGMTEFERDVDAGEAKLIAAATLFVADASVGRPARAIQEMVLDNAVTSDDAAVMAITFSSVAAATAIPGEGDAREKRWRFHSSDAFSARAARREVGAFLRQFSGDEYELFESELIVGELLANTVEHAPGLVEVCVDWSDERPTMSVRDSGPGMHRARYALPEDPFDENGRGLFLIKRMAHDVSVKGSPGYGSEVLVTLPIQRKKSARRPSFLDKAL